MADAERNLQEIRVQDVKEKKRKEMSNYQE